MAGDANSAGKKYAEANEQLIVEIYVRNLKQSIPFYEQLGFTICREEPGFVELGWGESRLYLEQIPAQPDPPKTWLPTSASWSRTSIDSGPSAAR